jgi:peptide/nickel transport system substrate-binding protein
MSKRIPKVGWIVLVYLLSLSLVIFPACAGGGGGGGIPYKNDGDFVQESLSDIESLDPAWAYDTSSGEQISYLYETLVYFDGNKTDQFVYVLAQNATWVNATTVRFYIRKGVQFSNGYNLTPEDVKYSLQREMIQNRAGGPIWMLLVPLCGTSGTRYSNGTVKDYIFDRIMNAVQVDGDYVVINEWPATAYSQTVLFQILSNTWGSIVSKQWCIEHGEWDGTANNGTGNSTQWQWYNNPPKSRSYLYNHAMGTGPWKFDLWDSGIQVRLLRNEGYWQGNATIPFNRVITKFVNEWTSRKLALLNGDADFIYVPRQYRDELIDVADLNKYADLPELALEAINFNLNISATSPYIGTGSFPNGIPTDFFSDPAVRKGFCYAFDYEKYLTDAWLGEGVMLGSPLVSGLAYYNPAASKYSQNLTLATQYLQNTSFGNLSALGGFKCTLVYNVGNDVRKTACEILAEALVTIDPNFRVSVQPITWPTMLAFFYEEPPASPALFCVGWQVDYPDADDFMYPYMETTGDYSYIQSYGNSTIDAMLDTARYSLNTTERHDLYYQLQEIYYQDCPSIVLAQPLGRRWFTKYVHGFYFNPAIPGQAGPLYYMTKSAS